MLHSFQQHVEGTDRRLGVDEILVSQVSRFALNPARQRMLALSTAKLQTLPVNCFRIRSTGHEIDVFADDFLTVMLPVTGTVHVQVGDASYSSDSAGSLGLLPSSRTTKVVPDDNRLFEAVMLKITVSDIRKLDVHVPQCRGVPYLQTEAAVIFSLRDLLKYTFRLLHSNSPLVKSPRVLRGLEVLVEEHIRCLFPIDGDELRLHIAPARLAAAEEFMRARFADPVSMRDIAEHIGVSVRYLQLLFQKSKGKTPRQHLSEIRMEEARFRLLAGDGRSVTDIALNCGFSHLGRFSHFYQLAYGERPSDTLRRNRKR